MGLYDFTAKTIDHKDRKLSDYRGKALLVVNVASRCGMTPHYAGLQKLYEQYAEQGLEVLGFPCNQFGAQEPGTEEEIREFCSTNYNVTFPMFEKIDVNGASRAPLYDWLTSQATEPEGPGDIKWNFTKFVLDRQGNVVARFSAPTPPEDPALVAAVEKSLG